MPNRRLTTPVAIIIGSVVIATGLAGGIVGAQFVPHYQLLSTGQTVLRLDTRTGEVANCTTYKTTNPALPNGDLDLLVWKCEALTYPRLTH